MTSHAARAPVRTVELEAIAEGAADGPPWTISGIAVAAGDVLTTADGERVLFTPEELKKAATTQADEPLTVDHPEDEEGRPQYPPPTDETVGRVQKAGWVSQAQGVGYEAATHDETIARGVQSGSYDVSIHPTFTLGEFVPEQGAHKAIEINFRDLSVVSQGESPSNTAEWGPNQALASATASLDVRQELTAELSIEAGREALIEALVDEGLEQDWLEAAGDEQLETLADVFDLDVSGSDEKTLDEIPIDEGLDALADATGLVHKDDLDALIEQKVAEKMAPGDDGGEAEATGGLSPEETERLDAYGTGVDEESEEALGTDQGPTPQAERLRTAALQAGDGDTENLDTYGTGVQQGRSDGGDGGREGQRHRELLAVAQGCETINQFALATGTSLDEARRLAAQYKVGSHLRETTEGYGTGVAED